MLTYDDVVTFWEDITNTHYSRYVGWHRSPSSTSYSANIACIPGLILAEYWA